MIDTVYRHVLKEYRAEDIKDIYFENSPIPSKEIVNETLPFFITNKEAFDYVFQNKYELSSDSINKAVVALVISRGYSPHKEEKIIHDLEYVSEKTGADLKTLNQQAHLTLMITEYGKDSFYGSDSENFAKKAGVQQKPLSTFKDKEIVDVLNALMELGGARDLDDVKKNTSLKPEQEVIDKKIIECHDHYQSEEAKRHMENGLKPTKKSIEDHLNKMIEEKDRDGRFSHYCRELKEFVTDEQRKKYQEMCYSEGKYWDLSSEVAREGYFLDIPVQKLHKHHLRKKEYGDMNIYYQVTGVRPKVSNRKAQKIYKAQTKKRTPLNYRPFLKQIHEMFGVPIKVKDPQKEFARAYKLGDFKMIRHLEEFYGVKPEDSTVKEAIKLYRRKGYTDKSLKGLFPDEKVDEVLGKTR